MTPATIWRQHADELAAWTDARLVVRRDVWGQYIPPERRTKPDKKTFTAPLLHRRGIEFLTVDHIRRHYCGGPILGSHSTSPAEMSRWGAFDDDAHDGDRRGATDRGGRLVAAMRERGADPLVTESSSDGGLHIRALFDAPIPTRDVFAWLQSVRETAGVECETFPKQATLPPGGFGNWLRWFGKHHTRDHCTRVAHRRRWLAGERAIRAILEHPLTPASIIPAQPIPIELPPADTATLPDDPARRDVRIERYLAALPVGKGVGTGRSDVAFSFARFLVHIAGLSDVDALPWLETWNGRNATPLPTAKLEDTIANARRYCSNHITRRVVVQDYRAVPAMVTP